MPSKIRGFFVKGSRFIRSTNTPCHCHHHCCRCRHRRRRRRGRHSRRRRRRRRRGRGRRRSAVVKTIKERFLNKMSDQAASNVTKQNQICFL